MSPARRVAVVGALACLPVVGLFPSAAYAATEQVDQQWSGRSTGYLCLYSDSYATGRSLPSRINVAFTAGKTGRASGLRISVLLHGGPYGSTSIAGALRATLSADQADGPGAALDSATLDVNAITQQPTDTASFDPSARLVTFVMPARASLASGSKYWMTLSTPTSTDTCFGIGWVAKSGQPAQQAFATNPDSSYRYDPASLNKAAWKFADLVLAPLASTLTASPYLSRGVLLPTVNGYKASLTDSASQVPLGGKLVSFSSGGRVVCSATTDAQGTAICPPGAGTPDQNGYTAVFAGDSDYLHSAGSAPLVS